MIWIPTLAAAILCLIALFVYAYKLASREGMDVYYETVPKFEKNLLLIWRGLGLTTGKLLLAVGIGLFVVIGIPIIYTFSKTGPWDPQWRFSLVTRLIIFPLIIIVSIFYFMNSRPTPPSGWVVALFCFSIIGAAKIAIDVFINMSHSAEVARQRPEQGAASLDNRLAQLQECGINLRPGVSLDSLRQSDLSGFLDRPGYDGVVMVMGGYGKSLDEPTFSDDVWYNDIECITEPEDYVRVAMHLRRLSKDDFAIENVRVETAEDGAEVALKFILQGKEYDLWASLGDDMIDVEVWAELQGLFESCCKEGRRLESVLYGQDGCYFYITADQKACLKELGLVFFN